MIRLASFLCVLGAAALAVAQDATPSVSPSPTPTPTLTLTLTPTPAPTLTPTAPTRSIRVSFLPPPLEGTISLGIYDERNKLVRVLHQEAELEEFTIGDDALTTKWDGRDDNGIDVPAGRYKARGFVVGKLKNEMASPAPASSATPPATSGTITVKLMSNPLGKGEHASVELGVGFDDENSYLKTNDGLPLYTIATKPNVQRAGIAKTGERSADVWEDDGTAVQQFRLSNLDKMMAFDCGDFELK
jgi:hypothetical protein